MLTLVLYAYMLGPWSIGPFTDLTSCLEAQAYQVREGGAVREEIGPCLTVPRCNVAVDGVCLPRDREHEGYDERQGE